MTKLAKLQIVGPLALLLALLAAEGAAIALAILPTSETLWYLNLQWFRMFQQSHYLLLDILKVSYSQLLTIALPLFSLGCIGLLLRRPLPLAVASNLSMIYVALVFFSSTGIFTYGKQASINSLATVPHPNWYVLLGLASCALLSFFVSHAIYVRSIYRET
jgi:NADH:ubiquinone oxidoreductase subunit K